MVVAAVIVVVQNYHSLVVELTKSKREEISYLCVRDLPYDHLLGGLERFREFLTFHGNRVYPEYLITYERCGGGPTRDDQVGGDGESPSLSAIVAEAEAATAAELENQKVLAAELAAAEL